MLVLVVNCGSSSIKADLIETPTGTRHGRLRVERVGTDQAQARLGDAAARPVSAEPAGPLLRTLLPELIAAAPAAVGAVGHRVVHGGERFVAPTRIDDDVEQAIDELAPLAPLHNPQNLAGIRAARAVCPSIPHVAVFDTAFHATLPARARHYAVPHALANAHGIRRYGFHGTSHGWVAQRAAEFFGEPVHQLRIITCHLGNGASVAAVEYGRSVETSMGMTPLEGLVMGTRSGDVDPGALLHIARAEGLDLDGLDTLLNERSGLAGLSGTGSDLRDIEARAAEGDDRCRLAMRVFAHRLRKYIGAYAAVMGGVDAIVFTGGIGQGSAEIRHMASARLEFLGAQLDERRNREARVSAAAPVFEISAHRGRTRLLVVATDEQRAIAQQARAVAEAADEVGTTRTIPIAISARHIHLTQATVERLFGPGHQLTPRNELSQPGQFACEETLTVVGPKRSLERVRVLGPVRRRNQVEVSRTDEFWLGVDAPVRNSGDVANSPGVTLEGPAGTVTLEEGLICAARHIHMTPQDADAFGVEDRDVVEVGINSEGRDLVFGDVLIRVSPKYRLEMHVDTDEANAAELGRKAEGLLVGTSGTARLRRRALRPDR
ncbi:MAG: acetate/propionate family kinase [Deltaproteobacteria bacterium]|nr:acetate/propionate family kinase [Deltaproteobacteria bacterium]